jgi:hypothetical protein
MHKKPHAARAARAAFAQPIYYPRTLVPRSKTSPRLIRADREVLHVCSTSLLAFLSSRLQLGSCGRSGSGSVDSSKPQTTNERTEACHSTQSMIFRCITSGKKHVAPFIPLRIESGLWNNCVREPNHENQHTELRGDEKYVHRPIHTPM